MLYYFIFSFIISAFIQLFLIYLTNKYHWFLDDPKSTKPQNFHVKNVPRSGGIGIFGGILLAFILPLWNKILFPSFLALISGVFEDFNHSLSPKTRLLLQVVAASSAVIVLGAVVTYLGLNITMPYWTGVIFSIFAIVGMMNAINIIDGFNGLAAGVTLVILMCFAYLSYQHQLINLLKLIILVMGSVYGFFIFNFPKGRIFLGDGGAYLLGFILALLGIYLAGHNQNISPWYILALFIYPVWEVIFSIIRKIYIGISPMQPDPNHLHMLIYRVITKNNPLTTILILLWILPFALYATYLSNNSKANILIALTFIITYLLFYYFLSSKNKTTS